MSIASVLVAKAKYILTKNLKYILRLTNSSNRKSITASEYILADSLILIMLVQST